MLENSYPIRTDLALESQERLQEARHPCSGRTAGKWSDCQYRDDRD